ncbi:hypothetical protein ACFYO2_29995 [Streptomyces sp. NPDC006602]|uniref:hypothetical protein n=1 Tax=Streptomyces sp. NPDC006602 TaxID=3364751 RepID=UPI0036998C80
MHLRGRRLKFTAVAALVVLSLTGFSSGRGHGHKSDSSGGGGCSSSSQNHDSSSSTTSGGSTYHDYDDDDYDTNGSGSGSGGATATATTLQDAEVELISCATGKTPYATVSVTNPNDSPGTFTVDLAFLDKQGDQVVLRSKQAYVSTRSTAKVKVNVDDAGLLSRIDHCEVDLYAPPVS